jgi:hypothetical protein
MLTTPIAMPGMLRNAGCAEWDRLLRRFIAATGDVITLQVQGAAAVLLSPGISFEQVLQRALVEKKLAKKALLAHLRGHSDCNASTAW